MLFTYRVVHQSLSSRRLEAEIKPKCLSWSRFTRWSGILAFDAFPLGNFSVTCDSECEMIFPVSPPASSHTAAV